MVRRKRLRRRTNEDMKIGENEGMKKKITCELMEGKERERKRKKV